ncbi:MAG: hypothetical protein IPH31_22210 [Lewinellaceae bacterium]|nr:hypothetical protein [Lewinellaceae bacterium]
MTVNLSGNLSIDQSPVFVDAWRPKQTATDMNAAWDSLTPNQKLIVGLNSNFGFNHTTYDINANLTQNIQNHSADASVKWMFMEKTFLESNFNYSLFKNDRFTFDRNVAFGMPHSALDRKKQPGRNPPRCLRLAQPTR